jgi:SpoVK/Ycf46/Vps4 family AAA+-type ATPase
LFDECEEFFRRRNLISNASERTHESLFANHPDIRTIGAFITSGMLPRLDALRHQHWVIFVVATNGGLNDLDDAVIREGRFDFSYEMKSLSLKDQMDIIDVELNNFSDEEINDISKYTNIRSRRKETKLRGIKQIFENDLKRFTDNNKGSTVVLVRHIIDIIRKVQNGETKLNSGELQVYISRRINQKGPQKLVEFD